MRPKITLLLLIAFVALASSAYVLIKTENEKTSCQNKCNRKESTAPQPSGDCNDLMNASFNHFIVSTIP
jgi:hypothetical protein